MIGPAQGPLHGHPSMRLTLQKAIAQADIVHIHAVWEEIQHQAATLARSLKKPYIFRSCGMLDPWQLQQGKMKKALYLKLRLKKDLNGAAALHFTSEEEHLLVRPLHLKPKAIVEANGVRIPSSNNPGSPERFREKFDIRKDERILLFLSRIHAKKGLDLLVPAFAKAGLPNVRLIIAGPDENGYQAQVEAMASQNSVQNQILFTGILHGTDKLDSYVAADLFVLPSYQENFGNVVVEALAAGTPVLISDQVNIHREISQGKVGGVVPIEVEELAQALKLWLTDDELRQSAAQRAQSFAQQNYDWNIIAGRWVQRYKAMCNQ
ncbi:MAG: glycosyltransferase [Proteobacteria bacterium]|nr:MAG: glycosyltransferase [Pseudomonadota bacterium]